MSPPVAAPAPVDQDAPPLLLSMIPLEMRHNVFAHMAAARKIKPRDTLRYWFEKQDCQDQIAELQSKDPGVNVVYIAGYNNRYNDDEEPEADDGQEVAVADEQEDQEDQEDEDEDQEDENDDDAGEDEDEQEAVMEDDEEGVAAAEEHASEDEDMASDEDVVQQAALTTGAVPTNNTATAAIPSDKPQTRAQNPQTDGDHVPQAEEDTADADIADSQEEDKYESAEQEQAGEDAADADMADAGGNDTTAASGPSQPQRITIRPHSKWRHVPKFMRLTQCPPETNLFLVCKPLQHEVNAWFYDQAILKIDATASFLHFSFFELALNKLADAAFSPMENIRKAEVTFVWDTTWIRAEESGFAGAVFPTFLQDRTNFIMNILLRAPQLKEVTIHWHDSAEDDGAKQLRADTLETLIMNLPCQVDTEDHYIARDFKPRAKSRAGKQRLEFKAIIDNGCETF